MTPSAVLSRLSQLGIKVCARGDRLRLEGSGDKPPADLLEELRAHREEILALVRASEADGVARALGGVTTLGLADRELLGMSLSAFAEARLVMVVTSRILGPVILASDNAILDPGERRTVYRASELQALFGLAPEHLRQLHQVKVIFGGRLVAN